jgi:hypothetical protein
MAVLSLNFIIASAAVLPDAYGQDVSPSEYQMKAAYLYNFAKFVEWPQAALPSNDSPLIFGVLGDDPFDGFLESTMQNKQIHGHPLVVKHFRTPDEAKSCHVLFISSSQKKRWRDIADALHESSVLTVSEDWDHFTQDGGMIYFFMDDKKVCFDINEEAATRAGLKISSKLMLLRKKPAA